MEGGKIRTVGSSLSARAKISQNTTALKSETGLRLQNKSMANRLQIVLGSCAISYRSQSDCVLLALDHIRTGRYQPWITFRLSTISFKSHLDSSLLTTHLVDCVSLATDHVWIMDRCRAIQFVSGRWTTLKSIWDIFISAQSWMQKFAHPSFKKMNPLKLI